MFIFKKKIINSLQLKEYFTPHLKYFNKYKDFRFVYNNYKIKFQNKIYNKKNK